MLSVYISMTSEEIQKNKDEKSAILKQYLQDFQNEMQAIEARQQELLVEIIALKQ